MADLDKPILARTRIHTWTIFGPSGVGKTSLAATAPRPVIMDANTGTSVIAEVPGLEHVREVTVKRMKTLDTVYERLSGAMSGKLDWTKKYRTLVFDHFDDIQGVVLDELADRAQSKDGDDRRDVDEIQQREWGILLNKMSRYLRRVKRLHIHKILICGEVHDSEDRLRPSIKGGLRDSYSYYNDHIVHMRYGKKGSRWIDLNPSDRWNAKTRARWFPPEYRRFRIEKNDTTFLSRLFGLVAAGPKGFAEASKQFQRGKIPVVSKL